MNPALAAARAVGHQPANPERVLPAPAVQDLQVQVLRLRAVAVGLRVLLAHRQVPPVPLQPSSTRTGKIALTGSPGIVSTTSMAVCPPPKGSSRATVR